MPKPVPLKDIYPGLQELLDKKDAEIAKEHAMSVKFASDILYHIHAANTCIEWHNRISEIYATRLEAEIAVLKGELMTYKSERIIIAKKIDGDPDSTLITQLEQLKAEIAELVKWKEDATIWMKREMGTADTKVWWDDMKKMKAENERLKEFIKWKGGCPIGARNGLISNDCTACIYHDLCPCGKKDSPLAMIRGIHIREFQENLSDLGFVGIDKLPEKYAIQLDKEFDPNFKCVICDKDMMHCECGKDEQDESPAPRQSSNITRAGCSAFGDCKYLQNGKCTYEGKCPPGPGVTTTAENIPGVERGKPGSSLGISVDDAAYGFLKDAKVSSLSSSFYRVCSGCGRKSWSAGPGQQCSMPQPDGKRCMGIFCEEQVADSIELPDWKTCKRRFNDDDFECKGCPGFAGCYKMRGDQ